MKRGFPPAAGPRSARTSRPHGATRRRELVRCRVHAGADSAVAAEQLGARAFTKGTDVHFGTGEFKPGTKEGDRLLAHELTHAAQAQQSGIQRKAASGNDEAAHDADAAEHDVSMPGDPAEREADAVGDAAVDALHGDKPASSGAAPQPPKAQLSGVGRKIHLSRKGEPQQQNDPAKASVKRLGKAGQDKTHLNDALKKVLRPAEGASDPGDDQHQDGDQRDGRSSQRCRHHRCNA